MLKLDDFQDLFLAGAFEAFLEGVQTQQEKTGSVVLNRLNAINVWNNSEFRGMLVKTFGLEKIRFIENNSMSVFTGAI